MADFILERVYAALRELEKIIGFMEGENARGFPDSTRSGERRSRSISTRRMSTYRAKSRRFSAHFPI